MPVASPAVAQQIIDAPDFLCAEQVENIELVEIPFPVGLCKIHYYLIWTPSALRQVRIAYARQTLLKGLRNQR